MASKTSAAADNEPVNVLFALHEKFNIMDFAGPLEVLSSALHDANNPCMKPLSNVFPRLCTSQLLLTAPSLAATKAFDITVAAAEPKVLSDAGVVIGSQISYKDAYERLDDFDIVIVVGGNVDPIIKAKAEPLGLISAYSELQKKDSARE